MLLGTGTRFDSVTRGVLDLRDLYFYASIVGIFLSLNLFSLERICWAGNSRVSPSRKLVDRSRPHAGQSCCRQFLASAN